MARNDKVVGVGEHAWAWRLPPVEKCIDPSLGVFAERRLRCLRMTSGESAEVKGGGQECPPHTGGVELSSTGQMGTSAPTWAFLRNKHDIVDEAGFADVRGDGDEGGLVDILSAGFMQFFERIGIDDAEVIEFDAGVLGESLLSCGN